MTFLVVQNKREGLVYGPRSSGGHFTFKPGANEVPKAYLDGLDADGVHALENLFQDGILDAELPEELSGGEPDALPPAEADHEHLPEDDAAALAAVAASGDRKQLSGWLEQERREAVFDALVDKLTTLDGGAALKP